MTENIEDRVGIVNELLREAFGEGTRGNITKIKFNFLVKGDEKYEEVKKLKRVIRRTSKGIEEIGIFLKPDGSVLMISERKDSENLGSYLDNAKKYSGLYEAEFGRRPLVRYNGKNLII